MIDLKKYQEAFQCLPQGAREAEVNAETHKITSVVVRNGKPEDVQFSESTALFVRVSGDKTGYYYTQDLQEDPKYAIQTAFANSAYSDRTIPDVMEQQPRVQDFGWQEAISDTSLLLSRAGEIENYVKERLTTSVLTVSIQAESFGQATVNSHGMDVRNCKPMYILEVGDACGANKEMGSATVTRVAPSIEDFDLDTIIEELKNRGFWQTNPESGFVSGEYPVIFSNIAAYTLFATAWQEFAAHKYTTDATIFAGKLGESIANECLSLTDYPALPGKGLTLLCDAEGTEGRRVEVVKKGVFSELINNRATAAQLGLEPTGNAGRRPLLFGNIATDLLVTPKNFCIEPGSASLKELEEHMGNGLLITEYFDIFHSLNISSGNFSVPCYAVRIENGKETGHLQALTMSGNFRDLMMDILEVGNDLALYPMEALNCYGIGACSLRIRKVMVSGE